MRAMTAPTPLLDNPVDADDHAIPTPHGSLFARRWTPSRRDGGVPLVLLHDSLGSVALWREFPQQLAAACRRVVVAYDRLGFGQSAAHPGQLPDSFVIDEAHNGFDPVRRALGIDAFIAFGHSVGGGMALGCAAAFPDDCRGVISEAAQAFVEPRTIAGIRAAEAQFADPAQRARLRRYHGDKADWVLDAWISTWTSPAFAGYTLDAVLRAVHCPVLVLHGDRDEYGSPRNPEHIAAAIGEAASLHLLAGHGHIPHREDAPRLLRIVADWLARRD